VGWSEEAIENGMAAYLGTEEMMEYDHDLDDPGEGEPVLWRDENGKPVDAYYPKQSVQRVSREAPRQREAPLWLLPRITPLSKREARSFLPVRAGLTLHIPP
jgi:hypothetical protein